MEDKSDAFLDRELTSIALCQRMVRPDGVALGFTGHDRPIWIAGLLYRPKPGLMPSAVSATASFAVDSMTVEGILDSALVTAMDLDLGRWRGSRVELFLCDWADPQAGRLMLAIGVVGEIYRTGSAGSGRFGIELLADRAALRLEGAPLVSPLCRAELGDGHCGVDLDGRSIDRVVVDGDGETLTLDEPVVQPQRFWHGQALLLSGAATGVRRRIAALEAGTVRLAEPIWGASLAGARVRLREGCDRRFATCRDRFGNAASFDGEPHVPGNDLMVRYGEG
jgi:uncharacterized phage protein (TIGR02218 family)